MAAIIAITKAENTSSKITFHWGLSHLICAYLKRVAFVHYTVDFLLFKAYEQVS